MYRSHFSLTQRPFAETVDPSWSVALPGRTALANRLRYGLEMGPGVVATIGPPGVGKTLLARTLARDVGGAVVHLTYPALPPAELLAALASEFARTVELAAPENSDGLASSLSRIRAALASALEQGKRPLLIVDEAHLIDDPAVFESLRLLLNFASGGAPDLGMFLVGLPDLMERLPESLADRVGAWCELLPLTASETSAYVLGRLALAGADVPRFDAEALERLYFESSGLPRRINRLADLALLIAFARELPLVTGEIMGLAAADVLFSQAA